MPNSVLWNKRFHMLSVYVNKLFAQGSSWTFGKLCLWARYWPGATGQYWWCCNVTATSPAWSRSWRAIGYWEEKPIFADWLSLAGARQVDLRLENVLKWADRRVLEGSAAHTNENAQERERTIHNKNLKEKAKERERMNERETMPIRSLKRKVRYWATTTQFVTT